MDSATHRPAVAPPLVGATELEQDWQDLNRRLQQTLPSATLGIQSLPVPGFQLALLQPDFPTGPLPQEVMRAVIANPAYWAFCWGSGLALAQFIAEQPQWVRGKRVLDLGSGSGVAGIAAALAGASHVIACDNDPHALAATQFNVKLNSLSVELESDLGRVADLPHIDIALLADVLYDRSNLPLLERTRAISTQVLVADSRLQTLPHPDFREIAQLEAITQPNLGEFDEFNVTRFFTLK